MLVARTFEAECPKETKEILDAVENVTLGLFDKTTDDGKLNITEIIAQMTESIADLGRAVDGAGDVSEEFSTYKTEVLNYLGHWGTNLGTQVLAKVAAVKATKAALEADKVVAEEVTEG